MIGEIVSGGQSGADEGGIKAALKANLPVGGWYPRGGWREAGGRHVRDPEALERWCLTECPEPRDASDMADCYRQRTRYNVLDADAVIWFGDPRSRGGRLTLGLCLRHPDKRGVTPNAVIGSPSLRRDETAAWLRKLYDGRRDLSLMVAGNRESSAPGIAAWVETWLLDLFALLGYPEPVGR